MKKLYYITRTYHPEKTGGSLMRQATVKYLSEYYDITVVTPNYENNELIVTSDIIKVPFGMNKRIAFTLARLGIFEDYLDFWVKKTYSILKETVTSKDIIFATTGGEIGTIKLAGLLKIKFNCKTVFNFRDPIDYSKIYNRKLDNKFYIPRENIIRKYLKTSDLIITSSEYYRDFLKMRHPKLKYRIYNNYFGYTEKCQLKNSQYSDNLRILYAGSFGELQTPEVLAEIVKDVSNTQAIFIGNYKINKAFERYIGTDKFKILDFMPNDKFKDYAMQNSDVAFVSLTNDYTGACVPSKIYEYINLGLPILGALPNGDAMDIINKKGYGIAVYYKDKNALKKAIEKFRDKEFLLKCKRNILKDRDSWAMGSRILEVIELLKI